jgi:hypothetical protein
MPGELTALIRDLEGLAHRIKLPQQASIAVSGGRTLSLVSSDGIAVSMKHRHDLRRLSLSRRRNPD